MTVQCSCGKVLDKVPAWLAQTNVQFVCNNCPNRTVRGITQVSLEPMRDPMVAEASIEDVDGDDATEESED